MDLRELRYFISVAEMKSFSKASLHLHVAQPALSRQIRKLEDELGVQLFIRAGGGLRITDAGALLLQRAQSLLRQVAITADDVRAQANSVSGTITLGTPPAAGEILVPSVIRECRRRYPGIQLNIVEGFSGFLYERLLNRELTLCVLHNPVPHPDVEIEPLLVEHMHLVGPGVLAWEGAVPPCTPELGTRLDQLPLILPSRPHSLRVLIENSLSEHGMRLNLAHQVEGLYMIKALVSEGVGYTVLTYGSVCREVEAGTLSETLLRDPEISWNFCIVHGHEPVARPVKALIEIIRDEACKLVDEGKWRGTPQYLPQPVDVPSLLEAVR